MTDAELGAWLRLTLTPGVGNTVARKLLVAFGTPQGVFEQDRAALAAVVGPRLTEALTVAPDDWPALCQRTTDWLAAACVMVAIASALLPWPAQSRR